MAIFNKTDHQSAKGFARAMPTLRGTPPEGAFSFVANGMIVVGDIVTEGIIRIEGEVRGTIRAAKSVVLGQGGRVVGDIVTEEAVIAGNVNGSITAGNRLELQSSCFVSGAIATRPKHLKLEEGARFRGHVQMLDDFADGSSTDTQAESLGSENTKIPRVAVAAKGAGSAAVAAGTTPVRGPHGHHGPTDPPQRDIPLQLGRQAESAGFPQPRQAGKSLTIKRLAVSTNFYSTFPPHFPTSVEN
jgi:cytoskeletal protein CcmA (bactofilin family)